MNDQKAIKSPLTGFIKHSTLQKSFNENVDSHLINSTLENKIITPINNKLLKNSF